MRLALLVILFSVYVYANDEGTYIDELQNDGENNENTVVSLNEEKRSTDEIGDTQDSTQYTYHEPNYNKMIESDDLMAVATSPVEIKTEEQLTNPDDLMAMRNKRDTTKSSKGEGTSFKQIHDFIYDNNDIMSPVSNELRNELTATASETKKIKQERKRNIETKREVDDTKGEMSNIFSGIQMSQHHKLTRSDIRKLAKKAVMLATLKKLNEVKSKTAEKKGNVSKSKNLKKTSKKSEKGTKKTKKKKSEKQSSTQHVKKSDESKEHTTKTKEKTKSQASSEDVPSTKETVEKPKEKPTLSISGKEVNPEKTNDNVGEMFSTATKKERKAEKMVDSIESVLKDSTDLSSKSSEMFEDISKPTKKSIMSIITDDSMGKLVSNIEKPSAKTEEDLDDLLEVKKDKSGATEDKKEKIEKPESDDIKKANDIIFGDTDNFKTSSPTKKSELPKSAMKDRITTLKYALSKSNPSKVPEKFFPDLPSGLRMIAWTKVLEKKMKELSQLEAVIGVTDTATDNKPVLINIDIDQDKADKDGSSELKGGDTKDVEYKDTVAEKKEIDKTNTHVHYLQKHIKGARALRKLIAKTLIGHCKTTGKRILRAFVAMDKALARAQAIATVIGEKFKIDPKRIDDLVGDKEDQVVETFLRDIFTKI